MGSSGNHHCANCIGTLSFPIGEILLANFAVGKQKIIFL